jgi:hypothetical protein
MLGFLQTQSDVASHFRLCQPAGQPVNRAISPHIANTLAVFKRRSGTTLRKIN